MQFAIVSGIDDAPALLDQLCQGLSEAVGQRVRPLMASSFPELGGMIRARLIEIAWAPPLLAAELEIEGRCQATLGIWRGAGANFSGTIFVAKDSPFKTLHDLKGKHIAWVDQQSASGYVFPRLQLRRMGIEPATFFRQESFHRTHERVAQAVLSGRADAGASCIAFYAGTGKVQSAGWMKNDAFEAEAARTLLLTDAIPTDSIITACSLSEERRTDVAKSLTKMAISREHRAAIRRLFAGDGFVPVDGQTYDKLRQMLTEAGKMTRQENHSIRPGVMPRSMTPPPWRK